MAVPSGNNDKRNTSGGAFTATTEGGTILGNVTTGSVITKALALKDNAVEWAQGTLPRILADGLNANQKVLSGGTFAYSAAGQYVIRTISSTLSGVSSSAMLIPDNAGPHYPIAQFQHDFGAKTTTLMRRNRYSRTGYLLNGDTKVGKRSANLWLSATGHAHHTPATNTDINMWDLADGNASDRAADSAANPTRAIPGELVMKVDFVDLSIATGGDFFDYKAITGM
tara:strand:- start:2661 stop:3338 length:678 start_codon:yes stop_codon:yes gene_type:complete